MYQYILFTVIVIIAVILTLCRLITYLMRRGQADAEPPARPETESTDTNPSIVITDEAASKKPAAYNTHGQVERANLRQSNKVPASSLGNSIDSVRSKTSFGFVPSIRSVAPLSNRGKRGTQNFLMLLDSLEPIEDEVRRRRQPKNPFTAASSSGIEANSSDETASQTLIGREFESTRESGGIQLDYIRLQNKD